MKTYSLSHLSDQTLTRDLRAMIDRDRTTTASLIAHIAEFDARKLYLPAGHPSMFAYCVQHLHLCEQAAYKRIRTARTARQYPEIFEALAEGRLHLSAVVLLTPHLTQENASALLKLAEHKSKAEIEQLLAERFPQADLPTRLLPIPSPGMPESVPTLQLSPGTVAPGGAIPMETPSGDAATKGHWMAAAQASTPVASPAPPARVAPLSPQRFALQVTIEKSTHEMLRYAQELLSHQALSGDVAKVLDRALAALIRELEKTKFAATPRPRPSRRPSAPGERHIPSEVKRTVWERDGGQCTFVA